MSGGVIGDGGCSGIGDSGGVVPRGGGGGCDSSIPSRFAMYFSKGGGSLSGLDCMISDVDGELCIEGGDAGSGGSAGGSGASSGGDGGGAGGGGDGESSNESSNEGEDVVLDASFISPSSVSGEDGSPNNMLMLVGTLRGYTGPKFIVHFLAMGGSCRCCLLAAALVGACACIWCCSVGH